MRRAASAFVILWAAAFFAAAVFPAFAEKRTKSARTSARNSEISIGIGHGIGFLPLYVAQDLKLLDKHAKAAKLAAQLSIRRYEAAEALHRALAKREIAAGSFGLPAFLRARESGDFPNELIAVSGLTTLPLVLLTTRLDIKSLSDLKPKDRIAVPMLTAPQTSYLRMQSEKLSSGAWNKLRQQIVVMPHQEAVDALTARKDPVAAYFSSPPFTQVALKEPKVRAVFSSTDAIGGKTSFLIVAAARETLKAQPKFAEVVSKAIDEAATIIRNDPRRAAVIWLKYEPSQTLDARGVEAILRELKDEFGSGIYGVEAMAAFMSRNGRLKSAPKSWKDVVAPALAGGSGS